MWCPLTVRHDAGFLRVTERPMMDHLAVAMNEFEQEHGPITDAIVVLCEEDKYVELMVRCSQ